MDSHANIRNSDDLRVLGHQIEMCGDSLLKLMQSLDSYIAGVQDAFKSQREIVERELEEAEEYLYNAEISADRCHASQKWDDEDDCWRPSCNYEDARVEAARRQVDAIREKLSRIDDIIRDVAYEKDCFYNVPCIIESPGAGYRLKWLGGVHSDDAIKALSPIIADVVEYENCDMSIGGDKVTAFREGEENVRKMAADIYPDDDPESKSDRFRRAIEKIKSDQVRELGEGNLADVVVRCLKCGRPINNCICQRLRERER